MDGRLLNIPESVSLALHSLKTLVNVGGTMSAGEISRRTGMSANHLSKVLRRLVVGGIICASKGPNGGFFLTYCNIDTDNVFAPLIYYCINANS